MRTVINCEMGLDKCASLCYARGAIVVGSSRPEISATISHKFLSRPIWRPTISHKIHSNPTPENFKIRISQGELPES